MSSRTMSEIIRSKTVEDLHQVILDYRRLESEGCIGDCTLRRLAREVCKELGIPTYNIVFMMEKTAMGAYRYFYETYFEQLTTLLPPLDYEELAKELLGEIED